MPKQLLESDFLTVNLSSIFNAKPNVQKNTDAVEQPISSTTEQRRDLQKITNWGKELKSRLSANRSLSADAREDEYNIETQFFEDYFNTNWDKTCAKALLSMGEPLRKALKVLGFDKTTNPILAFISDDFVKNELIRTKLLNSSTFKAVYNAVAKKLIADSEFTSVNDYNIIYCKDLYKKPLTDIMKYLELQSEILEVSANEYSVGVISQNKRVFLASSDIDENDTESAHNKIETVITGVLNDLEVARKIYSSMNSLVKLDNKARAVLADKLKTTPQILAAIQFLSMTTESKEARKALSHEKFSKVQMVDLAKATSEVAAIMPKNKIATAEADALINTLLNKLH